MSDVPRNNVGSLRIRASPPRNNKGAKKLWIADTWLEKDSYLRILALKLNKLTHNFDEIDREIQNLERRIRTIRIRNGEFANENSITTYEDRILSFRERQELIVKKHEELLVEFNELKSTTATPMAERRNRKTRKSRN
jgi:hypothetical protein